MSTGPEILAQCVSEGLELDAFSCAMGTGGTLSGIPFIQPCVPLTSASLITHYPLLSPIAHILRAGVAEHLRAIRPKAKVFLTDPAGAALYRYFETGSLESVGSSITEGIGQGRITGNMQGFKPDDQFEIQDEEALPVLFDLMMNEVTS